MEQEIISDSIRRNLETTGIWLPIFFFWVCFIFIMTFATIMRIRRQRRLRQQLELNMAAAAQVQSQNNYGGPQVYYDQQQQMYMQQHHGYQPNGQPMMVVYDSNYGQNNYPSPNYNGSPPVYYSGNAPTGQPVHSGQQQPQNVQYYSAGPQQPK